jgi:hypothetical protein
MIKMIYMNITIYRFQNACGTSGKEERRNKDTIHRNEIFKIVKCCTRTNRMKE